MRVRSAFAIVAIAVVGLLACESDPAPAPDAGRACVADLGETCTPCFEAIGRCCFEDATTFGQTPSLAARCEGDPACAICCAECAARTCDAIRAEGDCPLR